MFDLPVVYEFLSPKERWLVRQQYIEKQSGFCMYCNQRLDEPAPKYIIENNIDWDLFPPNFLENPIHLQHNHQTGLTEGAVHAYCNAYMWQYEGR